MLEQEDKSRLDSMMKSMDAEFVKQALKYPDVKQLLADLEVLKTQDWTDEFISGYYAAAGDLVLYHKLQGPTRKEKLNALALGDLRSMYVIYFTDVDADTGYVSQMRPVAHIENEEYAKVITEFLSNDDDEFPLRTYKYQKL